jgi:endonuclease/exonuclease/phosphatase family metal-dependent hydrolase
MDPEVSITVRTLNTWIRGPAYARRLSLISGKLRGVDPDSFGLIGLQEVARPIRWPWSKDGGTLFAAALSARFGERVSARRAGEVGIIAGGEWELLGHRSWRLGMDDWRKNLWSIPYCRYLLEAELRHVAQGHRLRFYSTHLSHGDQEKQRRDQIRRLIALVLQRARPGELPPLLAGDFNATPGSVVYTLLEEHFALSHADTVDAIWAGRASSFPQAVGNYAVGATSVLDLISEGLCDAHNSPAVTLEVDP